MPYDHKPVQWIRHLLEFHGLDDRPEDSDIVSRNFYGFIITDKNTTKKGYRHRNIVVNPVNLYKTLK